jgi:hypothetical protein
MSTVNAAAGAPIFLDPMRVPHWDVCIAFPKENEGQDVIRVYTHKVKLACMNFFAGLFETEPGAKESKKEYVMTADVVDAGLSPSAFVSVLPNLYEEFEVPGVAACRGRGAPGWLMDVERIIAMAGVENVDVAARLRHRCLMCHDADAVIGWNTCITCHKYERYDPDDPQERKFLTHYTGRTFATPAAVRQLLVNIATYAGAKITCESLKLMISSTIGSTFLDDAEAKAVLDILKTKPHNIECIDLYRHVYHAMMRPWTYSGPHEHIHRCYNWSTVDGKHGIAPRPLTYRIIEARGYAMHREWISNSNSSCCVCHM